jgi:ABC-type microcin C transport system duplicated ATPase subunit YejF
MTPTPLLKVEDLHVAFRLHDADGRAHRIEAVGRGEQGVSFEVPSNTTVAIVGESGSGKSVTAMALVQLLPRNAECSGRVMWRGDDLLQAPRAHMQRLRGREIACVFQDPMSSLNPVLTVGEQIAEPMRKHLSLGRAAARGRAQELLAEVGIAHPRRRLDAYPHQLSGGQQQRVMIAMALACEPQLLIADEPTTALDVTIQRQILELLARLQAQRGLAMLFISHDLAVVGESGSGKTTMGLTLLRLHDAASGPLAGRVLLHGHDLLALAPASRLAMRRRIQIVFQNPYESLNPRFTIGQTLVEPMAIHGIGVDAAARERRARDWLLRVGLDEAAMHKYPHEFSGGQRQRIAIARSLTLSPDVLVLDEAVAALDVSVQAQVLNLLKDLQDELGLAYIFISHDLAVVRFMADDVMVMKDGRVVEHRRTETLLAHPQEDYTRRLIGAVARAPAGALRRGPPTAPRP